MPKITQNYPHSLGQQEATERIKKAIEKEKIDKANIVSKSKEEWVSDHELEYSMTIFGYNIDGNLVVSDSNVQITLNLPMVAVMVKGMIQNQMQQEMDRLLK